jgi:hypothetical protein
VIDLNGREREAPPPVPSMHPVRERVAEQAFDPAAQIALTLSSLISYTNPSVTDAKGCEFPSHAVPPTMPALLAWLNFYPRIECGEALRRLRPDTAVRRWFHATA